MRAMAFFSFHIIFLLAILDMLWTSLPRDEQGPFSKGDVYISYCLTQGLQI